MNVPHGSKSMWQEQAQRLLTGKTPVSDSDLPHLLEWMQDMNWPGATSIAAFIRSKGASTLDAVRKALQSNDSIWHYWILDQFGSAFDHSYWRALAPELRQLASTPDAEGAHVEALFVLAHHHLLPIGEIKAMLHRARAQSGLGSDAYKNVEDVIRSPGTSQ